ncbi:hypothetical protein [Methylibium rhizosphaerae]|jgi:hypothetical protein|uniref:hypothetical protein n=1 Tax=Methylibium rhizosphaerae TaxID=2570323 RepID=UPI0011267DF9|nr:hypothetical protein [Methylibium rhizosphaerae]
MSSVAHQNTQRGALLLKPHTMLYPPVARAAEDMSADSVRELNAGMGTIWKPAASVLDGSDSLLSMRYFSIQALQLRLGQLMQGRGVLHGPEINLFLKGRFDHVYVDTANYRRIAESATQVLGDPRGQPLYFDVPGQRLVIDMSRCFIADSSQATPAAVRGVVVMTESPRFKEFIDRHRCGLGADASNAQVVLAGNTLQDSARCVTRYVLKEPALQLTPPAEQLARDVSARVVARALLSGSAGEMQATVAAFAARWKQGLQATSKD